MKPRTTPCTLAATAVALTIPVAVLAQDPPHARFIVSAGLGGEIASLECGAVRRPVAFHRLAAELAGEPDAFALDAGNLIGASAISRLALAHDADAVARAIVSTGLRVLAVGHNDLAAPRETLLAAARALAARGVPYVLSNLACAPAAATLCGAVLDAGDQPPVFDSPAGRVAVVNVLAPAWLEFVARNRAAGVRLEDPAAALARAVRAARAADARWVVAIFEPDTTSALSDAVALADALPADARPDVLAVNGIASHTRSHISREGVLIIATLPAHAVVVEPQAPRPARAPSTGAVPEEVSRFTSEMSDWLCATLGQPLAGATLAEPMRAEDFADVLLDVARRVARAEVAVINQGAIARTARLPFEGTLTRLDVVSVLPFDNNLRVANVRGSVLSALARSPRAARFYFRGLSVEDGTVKINGRAIDNDLRYRVVTTDYVAEGGDGGIDDDQARWQPVSEGTLRDILLEWLARPRTRALREDALDLAHRTRWSLRLSVDGTLTWVAIANPVPNVYNDAQLARSQTVTLRGEAEVRADADHPDYTFDNSLRLRYGASRTLTPEGMDSGFAESADLIAGRSTLTYRAFRGGHARWYVPLPYGEMYTESEFSCPCPPAGMPGRDYHHLLFRPTAGARFEFSERFHLYAGLGIDWEVFQPTGNLTPSVVGGWLLRPGKLFSLGTRDVEGESQLDVSFRDWFGTTSTLVRFRARLAVPIFEPIQLTVGYDLFARYDAGQPAMGWSGDLNVGLRVTFRRLAQAFVF